MRYRLKECPRCHGDLAQHQEHWGEEFRCLQCSHTVGAETRQHQVPARELPHQAYEDWLMRKREKRLTKAAELQRLVRLGEPLQTAARALGIGRTTAQTLMKIEVIG